MPYIKQELREELEYPLNTLSGHLESMLIDKKEDRAGILNYVITSLIDSVYGPLKDAKYKDYNEAIGMLECCKLEFYRRGVAPYEDLKERENGSVLDSNFPSSKRSVRDFSRKIPIAKGGSTESLANVRRGSTKHIVANTTTKPEQIKIEFEPVRNPKEDINGK